MTNLEAGIIIVSRIANALIPLVTFGILVYAVWVYGLSNDYSCATDTWVCVTDMECQIEEDWKKKYCPNYR